MENFKCPTRKYVKARAKHLAKENCLSLDKALDEAARECGFFNWKYFSRFHDHKGGLELAFPQLLSKQKLLFDIARLHVWYETIKTYTQHVGSLSEINIETKLALLRDIAQYRAFHRRLLRWAEQSSLSIMDALRLRLDVISTRSSPCLERFETTLLQDESVKLALANNRKKMEQPEKIEGSVPACTRIVTGIHTEDVEYMTIGELKIKL